MQNTLDFTANYCERMVSESMNDAVGCCLWRIWQWDRLFRDVYTNNCTIKRLDSNGFSYVIRVFKKTVQIVTMNWNKIPNGAQSFKINPCTLRMTKGGLIVYSYTVAKTISLLEIPIWMKFTQIVFVWQYVVLSGIAFCRRFS